MPDEEFFRDSARECRMLARRTTNEKVKWQLLFWAREFDAIAADGEASNPRRFLRPLEAAD